MGWFKNKIRNWLSSYDDDFDDGHTVRATRMSLSKRRQEIDQISVHGMNFTIYPANGGYVLEYNVYDPKKDENEYTLHIIDSNTDLGEGISHVITYEMLRK